MAAIAFPVLASRSAWSSVQSLAVVPHRPRSFGGLAGLLFSVEFFDAALHFLGQPQVIKYFLAGGSGAIPYIADELMGDAEASCISCLRTGFFDGIPQSFF